MSVRLKAGIVGTGGIFYGWGDGSGHLPAYAWLVDDAALTAICDVNEKNLERAAAAVKKLYAEKAAEYRQNGFADLADLLVADAQNLKTYTNLEKMLQAEKLDIVDIITPCEHHPIAIRQSLAAGCNVLCEKPLARTWLETQQIVDDVKKSGKIFLYGENLIYADPYHDVTKLIRKGEIGELEALWVPMSISEPGSMNYTKGHVGSLLDMGSHAITLAWYIIGFDCVPTRVKALAPDGVSIRIDSRLFNGECVAMQVEDYASFAVEFEDPCTGRWVNAYIESSWSYDDSCAFRAIGSRGEIKIKDGQIIVVDSYGSEHVRGTYRYDGWLNVPKVPGYGGHPQQMKAMVQLVKTGGRPACDAKIGSETTAIAQAAYLSQSRGMKAVSMEEFKTYAASFTGKPETMIAELLDNGIKRQSPDRKDCGQ